MTFGYNAALAFGQSTAEVIDHAKSLLSSLVDKREETEVHNMPVSSEAEDGVNFESGDSASTDIPCTLSRRDRGETSMSIPENFAASDRQLIVFWKEIPPASCDFSRATWPNSRRSILRGNLAT
jgi:hypothetical protein